MSQPNYDLTRTLAPFLDRHLVFPLLEFLDTKKDLFSEEEVLQSKLQLLEKTNMVDFAGDIYKKLHKATELPQAMKDKRDEVVAKLTQLKEEAAPILEYIESQNLNKSKGDKISFDQFEITPQLLDSLLKFAKFQFECGNYSGASDFLGVYRSVSTNADKNLAALWGKLAAEILMLNWEDALKDLNTLKETVEGKNSAPPLKQLQQRAWLMHWSLFVYFNHPQGKMQLIDFFFSEKYLNTIQSSCPHLLRYLATAVITTKKRRTIVKDLVKIIQQETNTYKDPITEFLEALFVRFDFDEAQKHLKECETVLNNDFFLVSCKEEFLENARLFIFETYCRIHSRIDIAVLADKLNIDKQSAERWIVNLIRNAKLDAKIDSKEGHVIMGTQYPTVYQKIIEKTRGLSFRSSVLANNLSKSDMGWVKTEEDNE